jgi:leader peptidase (prepilin peptidase) / N-methyltransferase
MPDTVALAALAIAASLSAWGARRDLQMPLWLTFAAFACATATATLTGGASLAPIAALVLVCLLIAETDRRHNLIPDVFTLALLALAFVMPFGDDIPTRLIGAVALGATFLLIRQACSTWRGVEALGWGDVKLAVVMGAVLGPIYGFAAVAIAGVATLLAVAVRMRGGAILLGAPFGIGLAAATSIMAILRVILP